MHETVFERKINSKPVTSRTSNIAEFLEPKIKKVAFDNSGSFG
jgi:hypothetical protein